MHRIVLQAFVYVQAVLVYCLVELWMPEGFHFSVLFYYNLFYSWSILFIAFI